MILNVLKAGKGLSMSSLETEARDFLKESITGRIETGAAVSAILDLGVVPVGSDDYKELNTFSKNYLKYGGNQMNTTFRKVDRLSDSTVETFSHFFSSVLEDEALNGFLTAENIADDHKYVEAVRTSVNEALISLGGSLGVSAERTLQESLNNAALFNNSTSGLSKNRWKKALRLLARIEETLNRAESNIADREASICGKSRLSFMIDVDSLDNATLAAVAYLTARANRRSVFSAKDQSKAFDTIYDILVKQLDETSNWFELAKVYPTGASFQHLNDSEKGELLGIFYAKMESYGNKLGELYAGLPNLAQENMVTTQGTDSSRWNIYSGAYNTMRSAWLNLTLFSGFGHIFETFLPGKAPRIMAADLIYSRMSSGDDLHPDTGLFYTFPKPWEVLAGKATIDIEEARKHDGWGAPLSDVKTEKPSHEPALVHGVEIASPALAEMMRKSGAFAGNKARR